MSDTGIHLSAFEWKYNEADDAFTHADVTLVHEGVRFHLLVEDHEARFTHDPYEYPHNLANRLATADDLKEAAAAVVARLDENCPKEANWFPSYGGDDE